MYNLQDMYMYVYMYFIDNTRAATIERLFTTYVRV